MDLSKSQAISFSWIFGWLQWSEIVIHFYSLFNLNTEKNPELFLKIWRWTLVSWHCSTQICSNLDLRKSDCKLDKCIQSWMVELVCRKHLIVSHRGLWGKKRVAPCSLDFTAMHMDICGRSLFTTHCRQNNPETDRGKYKERKKQRNKQPVLKSWENQLCELHSSASSTIIISLWLLEMSYAHTLC